MSESELSSFAVELPLPAELERRFRVLGILDAVLTDHDFRYSYSTSFLDRPQRVGRFDNGAGDTIFAFFDDQGAFVRAFDHEDDMSPYEAGELWPGLLDGLPDHARPLVAIPELGDEEEYPSITLALWSDGGPWQHGTPHATDEGEEPEPTTFMFRLLVSDFEASTIAADLTRYYGVELSPDALAPYLDLAPLTREHVLAVNGSPNWSVLQQIADYAGYPSDLA